jgi:putative ABC transport system permease protein
MGLLGAFAVAAALLATIGLFGVLSYAVGQRTRELGVRLALGARPRDLVRLLLGEGLWVAAIGLAVGAAIAAGASRLLASLLFQTSPLDPVAFVTTSALLLATCALAALVPALRAGRVDPSRALHAE